MDLRSAILGSGMALFLLIAPGLAGAQERGADASLTGISNTFNPAISVNGLLYALGTSPDPKGKPVEDELKPGLQVQEVEVNFSSNVDPYLKAVATLSVHGAEDQTVDWEEFYLTTLGLPAGLQARLGRGYVPFGLHNQLHTHAWPFLYPPLINTSLFGRQDGFKDNGAELSWLPRLPWYLEVKGAVYDGQIERVFNGRHQSDLAYLGRIENLWDLGESATLRLGGSFAQGPHLLPGNTTTPEKEVNSQLWGADAQFKWRPVKGNRRRAVVLQAEYLNHRELDGDHWSEPFDGYYAHVLVQVSRRFWVQGRWDETWERQNYLALSGPIPQTREDHRWSAAVAFMPSEFQAYKIGYDAQDNAGAPVFRVWLQTNVTIGSHPAHVY